jgi:hypothetical protein
MRATSTFIFVSGCLFVAAASSYAQSLADVARKEEERRKTQAPATKVYTNKDLGEAPPATVPAPSQAAGGSASPSSSAESTPSSTTDATKKGDQKEAKDSKDAREAKDDKTEAQGQAYWAKRMKTARETLDRDSTFADALQSRISALTTDFVNRDDPAQRSTIERDRQKAIAELDRLKKQIVDDRKAVADIEEEARRAGVPPGWLR